MGDSFVTYLELIAAKAKQMAQDAAAMWPDDVRNGLAEIRRSVDDAERAYSQRRAR
ncbi:MAG: hypothetical protein HC889_16135 [Synechococcaceae cyanobacterium SM1_2_3]|nr:hypothetical protein [Synechococcaceae cyanobacterium SM1_2_3]